MIELRLPSLGADMDEGKLLEWRVRPGEAVKKGQIVCVVDTAKAAIDVECWHDGIVHALLTEPGTTIPVGTLMAILREAGEAAAEVDRRLAALREAQPAAAGAWVAAEKPAAVAEKVPAAPARPRRVSPAARKRAAELGVDIDAVQAAADGTVALADVERYAAAGAAPTAIAGAATPAPARPTSAAPAATPAPAKPAAAAATMAERAAQMRKVIGAAMARSKREIPHYYLADDVPLIAAMAWLAERNAGRPLTERLLLAPLLLAAVAAALRRYPDFNGFYRDGAFVPGEAIHIGVAISLRAGGLVTPALMDVDRKGIDQINRELLDLIARTRAGSLKATEISAATITVTSLGDQGVGSVFGVIYPPQVAIVGFGRPAERPWAVGGGLRVAPVVTATLAADHRASDGHRGGLFLAALRELLQNPDQLAGSRP
jgi:pyruvate dehydrogenase E2 component (dihydrolipoamide acetyltransferase)